MAGHPRRTECKFYSDIRQRLTHPFSFSSVFAQDHIKALGEANTRSTPTLSDLSKVALETVTMFCLVDLRSFPARENGMSATCILHSSFLEATNAMMFYNGDNEHALSCTGGGKMKGQVN